MTAEGCSQACALLLSVESIARVRKMADRDVAQAQAQDEAFRSYVQEATHGNGAAGELT